MASHTVGMRHIASIDGKRFESKVQTGSARGWEKKLTPVGNRTWFDERTRAALFRTSMIGDEDMHQPSRTAIGSDGGSAESWTTPFIANGTAEPASNGSHPAEHPCIALHRANSFTRISWPCWPLSRNHALPRQTSCIDSTPGHRSRYSPKVLHRGEAI